GQHSEPEVHVLYSCTAKPGTVQLVCFISGFSPEPLTVQWLVDGQPGILHGDTDPAKKDADAAPSAPAATPLSPRTSGGRARRTPATCTTRAPRPQTRTMPASAKVTVTPTRLPRKRRGRGRCRGSGAL
ncbi:unnamed protein product, partial [Lepidochelys kempii]